MVSPKKGTVEVGSSVVVKNHPLPARVLHIEGNSCQIQFVDDSVAVVRLSSVTKSIASQSSSSSTSGQRVNDSSGSSSTYNTRTTYTTKETVTKRSTRTVTTSSPRRRSKTPTKGATHRSRSRSASRYGTATTSSSRTSRSPGRKATLKKTPSPAKKTPGKSPVKKSPAARSPGRPATKSPGRTPAKAAPKSPEAKSPGRPKSPMAKSPARKPSPAKTPARRSPARKTPATAAKKTRATSKSPTRMQRKSVSPAREKDTSSQRAGPSRISTAAASTATALSEHSLAHERSSLSTPLVFSISQPVVNLGSSNSITRRIVSTGTSMEEEGEKPPQVYSKQAPRSSARITTMRTTAESNSSLEDEGEHLLRKGQVPVVEARGRWRRLVDRLPRVPLRFNLGATLGALFWFFLVPSLAVVLYLVCQKESCTVLKAPVLPKDLRSYFNWKLYVCYACFLAIEAVLQSLPLGRRVQGFPSKALKQRVAYDYRLNGWVNLLGTATLFGAMTYYGFPMVIPYRYNLQLLLTVVAFAPVLALLLYIKGHFGPWHHRFPPGTTGNMLNDYVKGRELSPRIGQTFDLAALCFRCGLLTWAVLLGSMAFHEYTTRGCFDYGFATSVVCQFLYICMVFFDEEYFLSSAFVTDDGLGYVAVAGNLVLMPFVSALPAKFLLEHRPPTLPSYCLAGIGLLFLLGLTGMHFAHKRKYQLRRNWPDPTSRGPGLDYLVDNQGNRLLVSGLWGVVRHPNYLADLFCHLAFALPCGHRHLLPFYSVLLSTVFLVARTVSVESKCRQRYGDLWNRYTQRVKYRLVPYVF